MDTPDFILEIPDCLDAETCAAIIARFESDPRRHPAKVGSNRAQQSAIKTGTDLPIRHLPDWEVFDRRIFDAYQKAFRAYAEKYPSGISFLRVRDDGYQIQKTEPGQQYTWHVDSDRLWCATRVIAGVLYLNDVAQGGETEFMYQNRAIKPQTGKIVLFPTSWNYVHRGVSPVSGDKYTVVTCFHHAQ